MLVCIIYCKIDRLASFTAKLTAWLCTPVMLRTVVTLLLIKNMKIEEFTY